MDHHDNHEYHSPFFTIQNGEHFYHPSILSRTQQFFPPYPPYQTNSYIYGVHPPAGASTPHQPTEQSSINSILDSNGWYIPTVTGSSSRETLPAPLGLPVFVPTPDNQIKIHDFWRGKFAPFPGYCSRPELLAVRENPTIKFHEPVPKQAVLRSHSFIPTSEIDKRNTVSTSTDAEIQEPIDNERFQFDKYADVFVPQYLKDVQKQAHRVGPLPPIPVFPSSSYIQSFLPSNLIEELCQPQSSTILSAPPATGCPALQIETYHTHWAILLAWELDKLAIDKETIVLWKTGVKVAIWADAEFLLFVPGIRENFPHLEIGDVIYMREIYEREQRGSGIAFEGRVVALRKREGYAHIYCPTLRYHIQQVLSPNLRSPGIFTPEDVLPLLFNISFVTNAYPMFMMELATAAMGSALTANLGFYNLARHWLFPNPEDILGPSSVRRSTDSKIRGQDWVDQGLNSEQKLAASSIALYQWPVPYLISGPPGTGKTRTIVESVLQVLRIQPESCILLCAPSNPATDTLVLRLRPFLQPHEMLRLNNQDRTFAEVPIRITQYCYSENDRFSLPPWKTLMKYRVIVCSCLDAGLLVAAQCTNSSLTQLETEVVQSLHPHRLVRRDLTPHWTHLFIDEAAQGSEPELLIPISVVFAQLQSTNEVENGVSLMSTPQIVLCGDCQQLGPIVVSERARTSELDVSLLERLLERPIYTKRAQNRSRMDKYWPHPQVSEFNPCTDLVKNYRSHHAILMPPSAIFYADSLEPCAMNGAIRWSGLRNPELPLIFFGHDYPEGCVDERATWYNNGEIDKIVGIISSLLLGGSTCSPPLEPADIGIMAPWREQVWRLRERLRSEKLSAVDVGNVEDYQGRESRVIIISCVRSQPRFVKEDLARGLGLIFEKKRMNVAITRARELLIVVGNGSVLKQDPYWKGFLQFTLRNKLYEGPDLDLEMDGNYISRLESIYFNTRQGESKDEERGVVLAGGIARDILGGG